MHLRTQTGHLTHKHALYTPLTILEGHPQVQWFYCRSWLTAPSSSMARKVIWITKPHANTKGALLGKTRHDARNPMSAAKVCIQNKLQLWMPCTQHTGGRVSDVINSQKKTKRAVVAQWIRPRTLNCEIRGSNLLAVAVVPLGKALYPHYLVPQKGSWSTGSLLISTLFSIVSR